MRLPLLTCSLLIALAAAAAADAPSAPPAPNPGPSVTRPRLCTLKATTIVFQKLHIDPTDSEHEIKAITDIEDKLFAAHIKINGGPILIFLEPPVDPGAAVDLEIGIPVPDGTQAPEGCETRTLAATPCVTAIYQGRISAIGESANNVFEQLPDLHQTPGTEFRTRSLYYEGLDSPNNITLLEVPVTPAK
ncbi:MAG TPA: GyrI-like domain-containing protein [Phycisphaerae bacterium]|nr:GyrI-like domain-containing protein [Phycisphaerae bacterium]